MEATGSTNSSRLLQEIYAQSPYLVKRDREETEGGKRDNYKKSDAFYF